MTEALFGKTCRKAALDLGIEEQADLAAYTESSHRKDPPSREGVNPQGRTPRYWLGVSRGQSVRGGTIRSCRHSAMTRERWKKINGLAKNIAERRYNEFPAFELYACDEGKTIAVRDWRRRDPPYPTDCLPRSVLNGKALTLRVVRIHLFIELSRAYFGQGHSFCNFLIDPLVALQL